MRFVATKEVRLNGRAFSVGDDIVVPDDEAAPYLASNAFFRVDQGPPEPYRPSRNRLSVPERGKSLRSPCH
jgi:hypothetical protein